MMLSFKRQGYDQWIQVIGSSVKFNCACTDFQVRKLTGHYRDKKELLPCKHLVPLLETIDLNFCVGYLWIPRRSR